MEKGTRCEGPDDCRMAISVQSYLKIDRIDQAEKQLKVIHNPDLSSPGLSFRLIGEPAASRSMRQLGTGDFQVYQDYTSAHAAGHVSLG